MYILKVMEPILQTYTERSRIRGDNSELCVVEAKLSWIIHIIAAILKVKQSTGSR
ncbi:hypothetical protein IFM89_039952 [Coptis chinensis]|uniref:Exportin-7/Ran-binding protein 17 TPR repeats domain-containing protein n=1 Tax=Coptis chinensis TaxID=261450 RepID=A0A835LCL5_9MAGN|nr:hypothetical protein IFM89_039952 [Coptis chinensis]